MKVRKARNQNLENEMMKNDPELYDRLGEYMSKYGGKVKFQKDSNEIIIESDDFTTYDNKILNIVAQSITEGDLAKMIKLGPFLKTIYNVLYNHTKPFTLDKLAEQLGINKDNTTKFVNRMIDAGIMAYTVCAPSGVRGRIYMINPQLMRKRKHFHKDIFTFFKEIKDITEEDRPIKKGKRSNEHKIGIEPNLDF